MPDQSMRDHAVALTAFFRVFKLVINGKTPAIEGWTAAASNDPAVVREMWTCPVTGESLDNNIGIACGEGLFVLDVDTKNGRNGYLTLSMLEDSGLDTNTPRVRTPSGGLHLYYQHPLDVFIPNHGEMKDLPGIDVRGWHGYVVAPPSVLPNGNYRWISKGESHAQDA